MTSKNRLSGEKSPYLLQHQDNPVDWYPWCEEAFQRAKEEDKLVFLSIGYSTCHWCHVMAHESFEDIEIAQILNDNFISVKVDREERTDLDHIYMTAVQALTGSGGWPLTVFLTPEKKPVTGGTYFPPEDRWGRPGMKTLLPRLADVWNTEKQQMVKASDQMTEILQRKTPASTDWQPSEDILTKTFEQLEGNFDAQHGGFGGAPKFPRSHDLSFLLRHYDRTQSKKALQMAKHTLEQMASGGIYDHLGGGIARYSTDEKWLVPHFEKMLYDQAAIVRTYAEAYQVTKFPLFAKVIDEIYNYIQRDLTSPEGGFYSAEDADSEGEEGKFYVWDPLEVKKVLGEEAGEIFCEYFNVTDAGNFEHQKTVLHLTESVESFAERKGLDLKAFSADLESWKLKMLAVRSKRIRPHLDDKILASWNGYMISSFAYAGRVLGEDNYIRLATNAAEFLMEKLVFDRRLYRRYREGERAILGFHDDYAFVVLGFMDLYEATYEMKWLVEAKRLLDQMIDLFWDEQAGAFFYTPKDGELLIARHKEFYDGAIPSSNSIAVGCLHRMSLLTGENKYLSHAFDVLKQNAAMMEQSPMNFTQAMIHVDALIGKNHEIVVAGANNNFKENKLSRVVREAFLPRSVIMASHSSLPEEQSRLFPLVREKSAKEGRLTVYICENFTCREPVHDIESFKSAVGIGS